MKIHYRLFIAFIIANATLGGCKKDNEQSKTQLISQQPWILTAYTITRLSDGQVTDGFAPITPCYRDDKYIFKPDFTYEGNAGTIKCAPADPQVFSIGSWKFKSNETILERITTTGVGIGTSEFNVVSLSANEMILSIEDGTYQHLVKYSH